MSASDECGHAEDDRVDSGSEAESSRDECCDHDERESRDDEQSKRASDLSPHDGAPTATACRSGSRRWFAASRSSSRTRSRESIASSFIAVSTSCCENLACVKRLVRRVIASEPSARSRQDAREVLVRGLRRLSCDPARGQDAFESRVRCDDRTTWVGLGAEVVERIVQNGGEFLRELRTRVPLKTSSTLGHEVRDHGCEHESEDHGGREPRDARFIGEAGVLVGRCWSNSPAPEQRLVTGLLRWLERPDCDGSRRTRRTGRGMPASPLATFADTGRTRFPALWRVSG